jgi:outer membrane protein assembly factor BamB
MNPKSTLAFTLAFVASGAGCAKSTDVSAPFNTDWLNDRGNSIAEVERSLRGAPPAPNTNVVVGLTDNAIVGTPLDGGRRWTRPASPDTLPAIAGNLVLYSAAGKVHALDATTGAPVWTVDSAGHRLRGAGDDGTTTVLSLGRAGGLRDSLLLGVTRSGSVKLRLESDKELGRPAALGGVAFVPWAGQYVSAIDLESGEESGRLLTRELVSHAIGVGRELFFGERGVMHFDAGIRLASTKQNALAAIPVRVLPGKPRWLPPGGELPAIDTGARARIRIYAAPRWTGSETRFASDRFAATYFRAVMVFDAQNAALSWTRALPSEIVGGAAAESGFVLCAADGKAYRFAAAGGAARTVDLGARLRACVVGADTLVVPAGDPPGTLAEQLAAVLGELDPEMAAAQAFLVTELGRLSDPGVTKTLIGLTTSARIPPDVRNRARDLLALRRSGAEHMLAALERQYDFLSGTLPPPTGPLAIALRAMGEKRAAPLLARHLNDPSTDLVDLEQAARALEELATPSELTSLKTFFALYRATADEVPLVHAVVSVAQALLRIGGAESKELLERAARDPLTRPEVTRALGALLAAPPAAGKAALSDR